MQDFYELHVAGLTRQLPVCRLNEHVSIAGFVIFGDVEMTVRGAEELLKIVPEFDILITAEAKGIPLAHEMARQSNKPYVVARKYPKLYMKDAVSVEVRSITTDKQQTLYIDRTEMDKLRNKRVLLVDDVVSTGESLRAVEVLVEKAEGRIAGRAAILAEGDAAKREDLCFLEELPLLFD